MARQTSMQGIQGTQGTAQPPPPIPKMETGAAGTPTARQIRDAARAEAKAEARAAVKGVVRSVVGQGGGSGPVVIAPPPPGQQTTSTGVPAGNPDDVPPNAYNLGMAGLVAVTVCVVGFPLVRLVSRWLEPRVRPLPLPAQDVTPQLQQLQESVDTMAIELERISEAQRFAAKLLSERAGAK